MIKRWFFDQMKIGQKCEIFNKIFITAHLACYMGLKTLKPYPTLSIDREKDMRFRDFWVDALFCSYSTFLLSYLKCTLTVMRILDYYK